ncbi:MAG: hypothetical protein Tsb009_40010 [Planctomycetaceae bacterium]
MVAEFIFDIMSWLSGNAFHKTLVAPQQAAESLSPHLYHIAHCGAIAVPFKLAQPAKIVMQKPKA